MSCLIYSGAVCNPVGGFGRLFDDTTSSQDVELL